MGVLPGHLADDLQCAGTPPGPHEEGDRLHPLQREHTFYDACDRTATARDPQPIYQNSNVSAKPTAAKILGKVGESLSRICCVRPPVERFTFVDENANLGTVMRYEEIELRILLLCGSDLLESFCIPGLWNEADMEVIVGDFGIVVVPRDAADTDRIMNHSSILRKYKNNIMVVKDDINHPMSVVSSTKSRLALQHGDGHVVDYLSQPVIDYILKSQLYINASG